MSSQQNGANSAKTVASVERPLTELPSGIQPLELVDFSDSPSEFEAHTIQFAHDGRLELRIELGRTHMHLNESLKLQNGIVVPLDQHTGDPVDVCVNGRLYARGEVVVLQQHLGVRITELVASVATA